LIYNIVVYSKYKKKGFVTLVNRKSRENPALTEKNQVIYSPVREVD